MIRLPLSLYGTRSKDGPQVEVDNDDEGGRVSLVVELAVGDVGSFRNRTADERIFDAVRFVEGSTSWQFVDVETLWGEARLLAGAVERFHNELRDIYVGEGLCIERELEPAEAYALASMLVHYAFEAERRW